MAKAGQKLKLFYETIALPLNDSMEISMNCPNHLKGIPEDCGEKINK